jgi:hypothetical protein
MAYYKSITNLTITGAKLLVEAAEAKANEIVRRLIQLTASAKLTSRCSAALRCCPPL